MGYASPQDFEKEEWIDVDEDRGVVRRQRVYRRLLMSMGMYRTAETEEDFAYVRNFRNLIQDDMGKFFDCELQVFRGSAFLILGEESRLGRCFPEENTLSDIVLLTNGLLLQKLEAGELEAPPDEQLVLPRETFRRLLEECRERYRGGFNKTFREMTTEEFSREVLDYMTQLNLIETRRDTVLIRPVAGKIAGKYPADFAAE